jgi:hypothetical protein
MTAGSVIGRSDGFCCKRGHFAILPSTISPSHTQLRLCTCRIYTGVEDFSRLTAVSLARARSSREAPYRRQLLSAGVRAAGQLAAATAHRRSWTFWGGG